MTKTEAYMIKLLAAFIKSEKPCPPADTDIIELINLAQTHSVQGIVSYMLLSLPKKEQPSGEEILAVLDNRYYTRIFIAGKRFDLFKQLDEKLSAAGIDHIPFKGVSLRELYPVPELRSFGDIDILIHEGDRRKAHELMISLGFKAKSDYDEVYSYRRNDEVYELHTHLMHSNINGAADYMGYFADEWAHAEKLRDHVFTFDKQYHLIYLITHIAKHLYGDGAGIRMYMDIAVYFRRYAEETDMTALFEELDKLNLSRFARNVFALCDRWFGVECGGKFEISDKDFDTFCEYTLSAGVFGFDDREHNAMKVRRNFEDNGHAVRFPRLRTVRIMVFPPYSSLKKYYPFIEKAPLLTPAAWAARAFSLATRRRDFSVDKLKRTMGAEKEAEYQYGVLKTFGLAGESGVKDR